jgi:hypothetical protein
MSMENSKTEGFSIAFWRKPAREELKTRFLGLNLLGILWLLGFTIFTVEWARRSQPFQLPTYWLYGVYAVLLVIVLVMRHLALRFSWIVFGVMLFAMWLHNKHEPPTALVIEFLVACGVFFMLEGMELAYTELRDKAPDQLPSTIARAIQEINQDRDAFYDAREFIVVLLLAWLTVSSDFEAARLPIVGLTQNRNLTLAFSLVFTSVLVIWFAQSPSKRLATKNSLAFLVVFQFAFVWRYCLKPIGTVMNRLQITYPGHLLATRLERLCAFQGGRNLPPSRRSFYLDALKSYGYSYPFVQDKVIVHHDTSAEFRHSSLVYFTNTAPRSEFSTTFQFDSKIAFADAKVRTFAVPLVGEQLEPAFEVGLRAIFEGKVLPKEFIERESSLELERDLTKPEKQLTYQIHSPSPLPNSVTDGASGIAAVVYLEVIVKLHKEAFKLPTGPAYAGRVSDYWEKRNVSPCGEYRFLLQIESSKQNMKLAKFVSNVIVWEGNHLEEFERVEKLGLTSTGLTRDQTIPYPLLGATYRFDWEVWPS